MLGGIAHWKPAVRLLAIVTCIALVDLSAVAFAAGRQHDALPVRPVALSNIATDLRRHVDGYSRDPESFGFSTTPGRPIIPADGHVRAVVDGREEFDPDASLRYALASLAKFTTGQDWRWRDRAATATDEVLQRNRDELVGHTAPQVDTTGNRLPNGWVSAETQGLLLSALSRLYVATGSNKWRTAADQVFETLLRYRGGRDDDDDEYVPWLSYVDGGGLLWFEQLPQGTVPTQTMTSHLSALIGIYDYTQIRSGTRRDRAEEVFAAGATTGLWYGPLLWNQLGATWTSHTKLVRSWDRHHVLVAQLRVMAEITGSEEFKALADTYYADGAIADFLTTGALPRGDVDAYSADLVNAVLPPVSPLQMPDPAAPERSIVGALTPDQRLASALRQLAHFSATGDTWSLEAAISTVDDLLDTTNRGLVPHKLALRNLAGERLSVPWYSAQTQGLLLSVLVRLEDATGQQRWADEAGAVFSSLRLARAYTPTTPRQPPDVWTSYVGDYSSKPYLWFEKYGPEKTPEIDDAPSYVLDSHLTAAIGVYDYWRMTGSALAARLFDGAVTTVEARLPEFRRAGAVSRTALQSEIHRLDHHRAVTHQLRLLAGMTDSRYLTACASDFARDAS